MFFMQGLKKSHPTTKLIHIISNPTRRHVKRNSDNISNTPDISNQRNEKVDTVWIFLLVLRFKMADIVCRKRTLEKCVGVKIEMRKLVGDIYSVINIFRG